MNTKPLIRRLLATLMVLIAITSIATGCGKDTSDTDSASVKTTNGVTGVSDVLASGVDAANAQSTTHVPTDEERAKAMKAAAASTEGVDFDLTKLSGVMIYSQVFDMVANPDNYKGKIIRNEGNYGEYYDDETDKLYRACVIPDATACCQQGIEFVLKDDSNAEEDLVVGLPVSVQGSFDTYYEGKVQYCTLRNAELV